MAKSLKSILIAGVILLAPSTWADRIADPGLSEGNPALHNIWGSENMRVVMAGQSCGEKAQQDNQPRNGKTMCAKSVREAIKCFMERLNIKTAGDCRCGDAAKDYVTCDNGAMQACGYRKVENVNSPECQQCGAVFVYKTSPTPRGQVYGHTEMHCKKNYSVYQAPHDEPWPRNPPDACWVPQNVATK